MDPTFLPNNPQVEPQDQWLIGLHSYNNLPPNSPVVLLYHHNHYVLICRYLAEQSSRVFWSACVNKTVSPVLYR